MKILQIDGGGIKGVIPALVLEELEERLKRECGKAIHEVFDLIIGTSSGAIIGAGLAAGVRAEDIKNFYLVDGVRLFGKKSPPFLWPFTSVYKRESFRDVIGRIEVEGRAINSLKLKELKTNYIATAYNLCTERTHFIKSDSSKDENYNLLDVISWSALSAFHYFGAITAPDYSWDDFNNDLTPSADNPQRVALFQDGGQGFYNNTIHYVLTEILAAAKNEKHLILSLGCGTVNHRVSLKKAKGLFRKIKECKSFLLGQARKESIINQVLAGSYVATHNNSIDFIRLDEEIDKKIEGLDRVKYVPNYKEIGQRVAGRIDDKLINRLKG